MIVEYDVIEANNSHKLVQLVNQAIKDGWQPFGGVSVADEGYYTHKQAVVKYA